MRGMVSIAIDGGQHALDPDDALLLMCSSTSSSTNHVSSRSRPSTRGIPLSQLGAAGNGVRGRAVELEIMIVGGDGAVLATQSSFFRIP